MLTILITFTIVYKNSAAYTHIKILHISVSDYTVALLQVLHQQQNNTKYSVNFDTLYINHLIRKGDNSSWKLTPSIIPKMSAKIGWTEPWRRAFMQPNIMYGHSLAFISRIRFAGTSGNFSS